MAELMAVIDGNTIPLASCDWVMWAPCRCVVGVCTTELGDEVTATEDQAWKRFYDRKRDIDRAKRRGYTVELVTHQRWRDELADLMRADCPHEEAADHG